MRPGVSLTEVSAIIDGLMAIPDTGNLATPKQIEVLMRTKLYNTREEAEAVPRADASQVIQEFINSNKARKKRKTDN